MVECLYLGVTNQSEGMYISVGESHLKKLELDEETKEKINNQLNDWEVNVYRKWYREDLCRGDVDEGEYTKVVPVKDIVSMHGSFSSNDVAGAYLIENSEFSGVVIRFDSYSGFGMSSKTSADYCIIKTNGEIIGKNSNRSGHCSTEVDEWSYTVYSLHHKA